MPAKGSSSISFKSPKEKFTLLALLGGIILDEKVLVSVVAFVDLLIFAEDKKTSLLFLL